MLQELPAQIHKEDYITGIPGRAILLTKKKKKKVSRVSVRLFEKVLQLLEESITSKSQGKKIIIKKSTLYLKHFQKELVITSVNSF